MSIWQVRDSSPSRSAVSLFTSLLFISTHISRRFLWFWRCTLVSSRRHHAHQLASLQALFLLLTQRSAKIQALDIWKQVGDFSFTLRDPFLLYPCCIVQWTLLWSQHEDFAWHQYCLSLSRRSVTLWIAALNQKRNIRKMKLTGLAPLFLRKIELYVCVHDRLVQSLYFVCSQIHPSWRIGLLVAAKSRFASRRSSTSS